MGGWWWNRASANRRYWFALFMIVLAVGLLIDGIATGSPFWIIAPIAIGAFMVAQFRRARNDRAR